MNQCHFLGNLVRDPDLRKTQSGKSVVNLSIAVNRRYKRGDQTAKETAFLDMEAWDTGADLIAAHFTKGDPIIVHCSIKEEEWEDKTTKQKRKKLKFRINSFEFVPSRSKRDDEAQAAAPASAPEETSEDGEIPF